jgi:hypothetical protein
MLIFMNKLFDYEKKLEKSENINFLHFNNIIFLKYQISIE